LLDFQDTVCLNAIQVVQFLEVLSQLFGRELADMEDPEREEEPRKCRCPAFLDGIDEVLC